MSRRANELARSRARDWVSSQIGHLLLDTRSDDQFIVCFPRSGSTWVRTVLCNLAVPWGRANPDVFNALIPGLTIRGALRARALRGPRIISSHTPYRLGLRRVVYLVRDGRDALVSYYHYQNRRRGSAHSVSFAQFLDEHLRGKHGEPWHENVFRWVTTGRAELGDNLHVVRYEDLLAEPAAQMRRVLRFLGVDATDGQLTTALEDASLETMRRVEARRTAQRIPQDQSFYRSGRATSGAGWFDGPMLERFGAVAGPAMDLCGYAVVPGAST